MTERSRFWDGTTTGDATDAPYDAGTEFARVLRALSFGSEITADKGGVCMDANGFSDYSATTPIANTARIASGLGVNQGTWHESDANVDIAIPTPAVSTRVDRVVLRKSWSSQTVRLTRIAGVEGAGAPALTQVFGTTWDVPLWRVSITTGAVITFIDDRRGIGAGHPHTIGLTVDSGTVDLSGASTVIANLPTLSSDLGTDTNLAAGVSTTLCTITLTPGKWRVHAGLTVMSPTAGTETDVWILDSTNGNYLRSGSATVSTANKNQSVEMTSKSYTVAANATVSLVAQSVTNASTAKQLSPNNSQGSATYIYAERIG